MSVLPVGMAGASGSYSVTNSIRLNGTTEYLVKTLTTSTTTSGSVWVKRSKLGATSPIFDNKVYFTSGDALYAFGLTSTALYRDPSAWYHVFWNGTGVYVNGTLVTGSGTYTAASVTNPRLGYDGTNYFSGYLSDFAFWNGSSASLQGGATDANGVWAAKRPAAGYSFLTFGSSGALGTDTSGNGNNWTVSGTPVQTTDTPTNNYCVLSAIDNYSAGLSNGGLSFVNSINGAAAMGAFYLSSGKWYFEFTANAVSPREWFGVATSLLAQTAGGAASRMLRYTGSYVTDSATPGASITTAIAQNDVIGIALDIDAGKMWLRKNGTWLNSGAPVWTDLAGKVWAPSINSEGAVSHNATANFGATAFAYTPPTGFNALCTANLPAVSIKKPSDHHNVVLAAGASIKSSSEALYTYFLEWIKVRADANNHQLIDTVRGSSAVLQSNTTAAETTYSAPSGTSVGWVWKAGGAASSNTAGSITSQVSANTTAGFSVVTYTGTGAIATIGHGLGSTPKLIVVKRRDTSGTNWRVYNASNGATGGMYLNLTNAFTPTAALWNDTAPTSAVFSVGTDTAINGSGGTYTAYCFAEIPGYSKFGSYTGNGSTDGPFVYTDFKPSWVMIKRTDVSGFSWHIYDTSRNTTNPVGTAIYADDTSGDDASVSPALDALANGFKIRTSSANRNASGANYIYAAFAEYPFGGSNVAPSPAR